MPSLPNVIRVIRWWRILKLKKKMSLGKPTRVWEYNIEMQLRGRVFA